MMRDTDDDDDVAADALPDARPVPVEFVQLDNWFRSPGCATGVCAWGPGDSCGRPHHKRVRAGRVA
jgi:hypothetical protein